MGFHQKKTITYSQDVGKCELQVGGLYVSTTVKNGWKILLLRKRYSKEKHALFFAGSTQDSNLHWPQFWSTGSIRRDDSRGCQNNVNCGNHQHLTNVGLCRIVITFGVSDHDWRLYGLSLVGLEVNDITIGIVLIVLALTCFNFRTFRFQTVQTVQPNQVSV